MPLGALFGSDEDADVEVRAALRRGGRHFAPRDISAQRIALDDGERAAIVTDHFAVRDGLAHPLGRSVAEPLELPGVLGIRSPRGDDIEVFDPDRSECRHVRTLPRSSATIGLSTPRSATARRLSSSTASSPVTTAAASSACGPLDTAAAPAACSAVSDRDGKATVVAA